jgi:Tfp pilus assembly protein PilF
MSRGAFRHPRQVLGTWALSLVLVAVVVGALNAALLRHAEARRARDYRVPLAAAIDRMQQQDLVGAKQFLDEAVRIAPDAPDAHATMGYFHYRRKSWRDAVASCSRAVSLGDKTPGTWVNLVWSLIELKRYDDALAVGRRAAEAGVSAPALDRYLAEANFRSGRHADAIRYYRDALTHYPDDLYLLERLKEACRTTGNHAEADRIEARIAEVEALLRDDEIAGPLPGAREE